MLYDVVIVGAGAAGLMTAITAARRKLSVLVLDAQKKIGAKILMSGGTRCNVTNKAVSEQDFNSNQIIRVRNILRAFDQHQTLAFFEELGVNMVLEADAHSNEGKYFPSTHSGKTILDALLAECARLNIPIKAEHKVLAVDFAGGQFDIKGNSFQYTARQLVLTTGGLSYPTTGSDGTGYRLAQGFGHSILPTMPALTPLVTKEEPYKQISGIALPVTVTLFAGGKKIARKTGDFLFTHFGFSGPVMLDISRHWLAQEHNVPALFVNFLPKETSESFHNLLSQARSHHPNQTLKTFLSDLFPERLGTLLLSKIGVEGQIRLNQLTKTAGQALVQACTHHVLPISGVVGYGKAEVTAGGIDLSEVNPKTLESKLRPGLFFAGEILDVDGRIGGFNFQWAWASGHRVGSSLK